VRLPTWDELIAEQLAIWEYPLDQSLFVAGPPGSGKTILAVHRAQAIAGARQSVAMVTFNRMLRRLMELLSGTTVHVSTMQSFVWNDYKARTGSGPPRPNAPHASYDYIWPAMLDTLNGHPRAGITKHHLVVDEGQDLPEDFFRYASRHVAGAITVFADEDQALGTRHTSLQQIKAAAGLSDPVLLQENHRNTPEVARVAEYFHSGRLPAATVRRKSMKELPRLVYSPSFHATADRVARWYQTRGGTLGIIVDSNTTGTAAYHALRSRLPGQRVDLYVWNSPNEDTINLLDSGVTILNKESVKGQEFDTVFVLELEAFIPCVTDVQRRVMYMVCARARDHLFLVSGPQPLSPEALAALPGEDLLERS
jgi:superfamily I DNA and RNA helicase